MLEIHFSYDEKQKQAISVQKMMSEDGLFPFHLLHKAESSEECFDISFRCTFREALAVLPLCLWREPMQVIARRTDIARGRRADRYEVLAGEIVALHKRIDDARCLPPPDGISDNDRVVFFEAFQFVLDGRARRFVLLLDRRTRRLIVVVEILFRVGFLRHDFELIGTEYLRRRACSGNCELSTRERAPQPVPSTMPTSCHSIYSHRRLYVAESTSIACAPLS